jgi:hypothetical protein
VSGVAEVARPATGRREEKMMSVNAVAVGMDDGVLRRVARRSEPIASVYMGSEPVAGPESGNDFPSRWQGMTARLTREGADPASVAALTWHLLPAAPGRPGMALFAAGGNLLLAAPMRGYDGPDTARFGAPAHLLPLLAFRQEQPAHVLVVTDRTGAEIVTTLAGDIVSHRVVVEGPDDEIERNAPGGWSQPRYQRRAEDSWRHNAAAVADATTRALQTADATLLLVVGDVRAVQLLEERLPRGVRRTVTVRHLPGGRQPDGSRPERDALVTRAIREHGTRETATLLGRFAEASGPAGHAVEGVAATLAALASGQVATLLVTHDPADERLAWYGPRPTPVYARPDDPTAEGMPLRPGRLADVAVRAALCTDATVRVLAPGTAGEPAEGLGALTRFG